MHEYEHLNHMRRAPAESEPSTQRVYIPHHPVYKVDSATTRLRVVFNASSFTSNGTSLNEFLTPGPKLQNDLSAVMLQWRQFQFVYTADIAKMYRQILIDERDIDYQRILWQPENAESVCDYQLLTVTYGMSCAPYLALRVLQCLAEDDGPRFPLAVPILHKQTYVDDVLFGAHDIRTLKHKRNDLVSLLRYGQFELRKWASNSTNLLDDIDPRDHGLACDKSLSTDETVKVLGIVWNPALGAFCYRVSLESSLPKTKRSILSIIARLYDPLGWVTPVTVAAKILMQHLWRQQLEWDSPLPSSILDHWESIYSQLAHLNHLRIKRWTGLLPGQRVELHGFADASTLAYAASVYLKFISADGEIHVTLLAGKSKVAPIKSITIPRLELLAAHLLARLLGFVRMTLELTSVSCFCWSDSTVTLTWLRSHPSRWATFVANRVSKIQELLPDVSWHHVPTYDNPADCASRGIHGGDILSHSTWWHGPPWLSLSREAWPPDFESSETEFPEEKKVTSLYVAEPVYHWELATRFSSWNKLIRVTAYLLRFIANCRRKSRTTEPPSCRAALSCQEVSDARFFWIRQIQGEVFHSDLRSLKTTRTVVPKSWILMKFFALATA
ncbi:uncharacterized protein LOC118646978 [Monomorium pharaonis]|uniref:uncharacterized protein LOC118646978 n=1 Tax=Monomorium pharaonis TaxID=307658 RepID=UPI001745F55E|nr:uncharacterized protein LOC118646978 [Monomorium pharaonis]